MWDEYVGRTKKGVRHYNKRPLQLTYRTTAEQIEKLANKYIEINAKYDAELTTLSETSSKGGEIIETVESEASIDEYSDQNDAELKPNLPGTRVAYSSYRGDTSNTSLREEFKVSFTDIAELPIPFSEKFESDITLSIDTESDYVRGNKEIQKLLADAKAGKAVEVGTLPVKATFKGKDGKTYIAYLYTSKGLIAQGYNTKEQIDNMLMLKQSVLEAYQQGSVVITKIDYNKSVLGGKYAKRMETFENVPASFGIPIEEFDLRISAENYYIKADGSEDLELDAPKKKGNVYSVHKNANGKKVPVKLWNNKVNAEVATTVLNLYRAINETNRKTEVSQEFKKWKFHKTTAKKIGIFTRLNHDKPLDPFFYAYQILLKQNFNI